MDILFGALVHDAFDGYDVFIANGLSSLHKSLVARKHDALHEAGAVAEVEEDQFALVAAYGDPAANRHGLSHMRAKLAYQNALHMAIK